jgi:hypothetical protein
MIFLPVSNLHSQNFLALLISNGLHSHMLLFETAGPVGKMCHMLAYTNKNL